MSKIIIPLIGYARSGKDTVANHLKRTYGYNTQKFAKPLYDMLCAMYDNQYSIDEFEAMKAADAKLPGMDVTVRRFLQLLGTEFGREMIDQNIWINLLIQRIENSSERVFVISDCRFINELNAITESFDDVFPIYVHRSSSVPQTHHKSEMDIQILSQREEVLSIENNKTIDDLHFAVEDYLKFLDVIE